MEFYSYVKNYTIQGEAGVCSVSRQVFWYGYTPFPISSLEYC
jgi:hypothetical protein